ncbi:putative transmembrane protein [Crotalus adamanteus]|uniref:Transmembrane protein n=1 Tax=Crotalus adamanteus TaxID=8729 RepID=A0AAW1C3J2_CROAD
MYPSNLLGRLFGTSGADFGREGGREKRPREPDFYRFRGSLSARLFGKELRPRGRARFALPARLVDSTGEKIRQRLQRKEPRGEENRGSVAAQGHSRRQQTGTHSPRKTLNLPDPRPRARRERKRLSGVRPTEELSHIKKKQNLNLIQESSVSEEQLNSESFQVTVGDTVMMFPPPPPPYFSDLFLLIEH